MPDTSAENSLTSQPIPGFNYQPLSAQDREIRLLRISGEADAPSEEENQIVCSLFHVSLDGDTEYKALSYAWGDASLKRTIKVDDQDVEITESLYTAIYHIRDDDTTPVVIWADAICINQNDDDEKSVQVQMMRDIYRNAAEVLVWLGPSTPETDTAMEWMGKLGQALLDLGLWELSGKDLSSWEAFSESDEPSTTETKVKFKEFVEQHLAWLEEGRDIFWWICLDIGARTWFSRVWCVQECTNGRIVTFLCGNKSIDFLPLWATAHFLAVFSSWVARRFTIRSASEAQQRVCTVLRCTANALPTSILGIRRVRLTQPSDSRLSLKSILCRANVVDAVGARINATQPKDRLYGLLGVANDPLAEQISINYRLACRDVYIDPAKVLLRNGHLDLLALCRKQDVHLQLPSWVPDWSAPNRTPWSRYREEGYFNVSLSSSATISFPDEPSSPPLLEIAGCFVDDIAQLGHTLPPLPDGMYEDFDCEKTGDYLNDISTFVVRSEMYDSMQKEDAVWRVAIGDLIRGGVTDQLARATSEAREGYDILRYAIDGVIEKSSSNYAFICFLARLDNMHDSRPFFSQSGYVGVCPMETCIGDRIIIFRGAQTPFVVRKADSGGTWRLVGEAYVFGIMDGEFMSRGDPIIENIRLS